MTLKKVQPLDDLEHIIRRMEKPKKIPSTIRKLKQGRADIKTPEGKERIVKDLLKAHPTLSAADISELIQTTDHTAAKYIAHLKRQRELINTYDEVIDTSIKEKLLLLVTSLDINKISHMTGLQIAQAFGIFYDKMDSLALKTAMRDSVSRVVEAIRKKRGRIGLNMQASGITVVVDEEQQSNDCTPHVIETAVDTQMTYKSMGKYVKDAVKEKRAEDPHPHQDIKRGALGGSTPL